LKQVPPTITDEIVLAKHYFKEATILAPADARAQGFLGDSMLVAGKIAKNDREQVRGYFQLKRSIAMWPEFNYFTAGYVRSSLDLQSAEFKEGLKWQWRRMSLLPIGVFYFILAMAALLVISVKLEQGIAGSHSSFNNCKVI